MTIDPIHYARRWKTLGVLSLSLFIIGLDNTILNVALPTLQDEFDASPSKLQWMVDSYLLVFAGLLLVFGTLGDRFGRKLALQAGVSIFGLASLGALVADSANEVIAVRAAMGVGAALIMPATLSIIANVFTGEERGKAIASGLPWQRSGSGSARWPAGCCSSGSVGRPSSWSTSRSRPSRCCSGSATCPKAVIPGPARSTCSEPRSPPQASASLCTRSSRRPSGAGRPVSYSGRSR